MAFATPELQARGRKAVSLIGVGKNYDKPDYTERGEHELALVRLEDALERVKAVLTLDEVLDLANDKLRTTSSN
jgi:hypothetical protein